jgi:hypothetical protein
MSRWMHSLSLKFSFLFANLIFDSIDPLYRFFSIKLFKYGLLEYLSPLSRMFSFLVRLRVLVKRVSEGV